MSKCWWANQDKSCDNEVVEINAPFCSESCHKRYADSGQPKQEQDGYKKVYQRILDRGYIPLKDRGYVKLPSGSAITWIHKEWLDKAVEKGILIKNRVGMFVPYAHKIMEYMQFEKEFKDWEYQQGATRQLKAKF